MSGSIHLRSLCTGQPNRRDLTVTIALRLIVVSTGFTVFQSELAYEQLMVLHFTVRRTCRAKCCGANNFRGSSTLKAKSALATR